MKFVAEEYGAQLHTAVLHLDEEFPHVHFTQSQRITKCGMRAEVIKPAKTNSKLEAKKAMQAYQDAYYEGCPSTAGTRLGPRRQRLTRVSGKPRKHTRA